MAVTMVTAGLLGLILIGLSLRVEMARQRARVAIGDGGDPLLLVRIRAHGNFVEHAPLALILLVLAEQALGGGVLVTGCAAVLVLARLAHPVGMERPAPNGWRAFGAAGTWAVVVLLSGALLWRGAGVLAAR